VGDNEPYRIEADMDYTVPVHGDARGLDAALLEVRQDLVTMAADVEKWASRIAVALSDVVRGRGAGS
jgi:predicted N-formylglutamate amidohydrolase